MGVNNVPPKVCTFSCVYCQLGRTMEMGTDRRDFFSPESIFREVSAHIGAAKRSGERVDFLTFVPDGEPTLDRNLGKDMDILRKLGTPIAVITNSSLIHRGEVREELSGADWVSLKVDAVSEPTWRKVDRPDRHLDLERILDGIGEFADIFQGELVIETMLVRGVNDSGEELERVADFLKGISPDLCCLSVPTRPPAESWVEPPVEEDLNRAYQLFRSRGMHVEMLTGYEGSTFASTGDAEEDLLGITSVHPMREDAVEDFLQGAGEGWSLVDELTDRGEMVRSDFGGHTYYLRRLRRVPRR